jgi:hypothetical protein
MDEQSLSNRVGLVEKRLSYLEEELDISYEEYRFEKRLESLSPNHASLSTRCGNFGFHAKITDINGDDANEITAKIDDFHDDLDYALTETASGLGIEVWTEGVGMENSR